MDRPSRWALLCFSLVVAVALPSRADGPPPPHWGYTGEESPAHWGDINATCATGQAQSPIAFSKAAATTKGPFPKMTIDWHPVTGEAVDNGHSIQVNVPPGNFLTYGDTKYELKQFHFHSPSEHTVNGKHSAIEMHLVNQTPEGKTAVLAVFLTLGKDNAALKPLFSNLPTKDDPKKVDIDLNALLPKDHTHFAYAGSLTTPPCTEGVQWLLMVTQSGVSQAQVDAFHTRYAANNRPTQPGHGRKVAIAH
jgi:carbonic anhydrase